MSTITQPSYKNATYKTLDSHLKLKIKVEKFFTLSKFMLVTPILLSEDIITMSMIYYTVTKYAYKFSPYITVNGVAVYIHKSYKAKLRVHSKDYFDVFCREVKYPFFYEPGKSITTTIGQLNFYKWCVEINLIEYIRENYDEIKYHMDLEKNDDSLSLSENYTITDEALLSTSERNKYTNRVRVVESIEPKF